MTASAPSWSRFEPMVRVVPRYLLLALSEDERMKLEDVLFERLDIASLLDWRGPTTDLFALERGAAPLEALALEVLGRTTSRLVEVEGLIAFDWGAPDRPVRLHDVEAKMPALPGHIPGTGPFRYFGHDDSIPPFLWTSFEPPGLQIAGTVEEQAWAAWTRKFAELFGDFPLRDLSW